MNTDLENVFYRCVEDSTEAIMITNRKGRLIYVNPAWQRIYEYPKEEAIGETPRLLRSRYQTDEFYSGMWRQILDPSRGFWRGELVNRAKSGKEVPVVLTITPVKQNGETFGYMGIAIDMTEKKNMEAQIFQQDRLASVGLLASGLAHEIGTPLGVIRGRAELMQNKLRENPDAVRNLGIIIQQIDRVSKLIRNLLNLSRAGRGKTMGSCNLAAVVHDSVSLLSQKFRDYGIEVVSSIPDDTVVRIDHNQLEQVLINLLVNAVHAIREVYASGKQDGHFIRFAAHKEDGRVDLFVSDTGGGIPKDVAVNLFRPFFTTKPVGEGTGLGLSISAQILSENGGLLTLHDSQEGQGTTFKLELPSV